MLREEGETEQHSGTDAGSAYVHLT